MNNYTSIPDSDYDFTGKRFRPMTRHWENHPKVTWAVYDFKLRIYVPPISTLEETAVKKAIELNEEID